MSIKKRIQILLAFLVGIPFLLLLYESYNTGRKTLIEEMQKETLQVAKLETAEMDLTFETPRIIADGLVRVLETDSQLNPERIYKLLNRTLSEAPEIYGIGVVLDPGATPLKRFAPYASRRKDGKLLITLPYDYTKSDWYLAPIQAGRGKWIKPYYGEGGATLMVTYAAPLKINSKTIGVVAVDLDLDGLLQRLHFLKPGSNGTVYLVNQAGRILAHPALKPIADLPQNHELADLKKLIKHPGLDTVTMKDPVTGRTSLLVESPVRSLSMDRGGENWSLIVSWPVDKKLAPLNSMGRRLLVLYLFLGGAALWFLNRTIDDTVIRPIRQLTEQATSYAQGDSNSQQDLLYDIKELRELKQALNSLRPVPNNSDETPPGAGEDKS